MFTTYLNRVVAVGMVLMGLAGAVAVPLLNADLQTTAGIIAAVIASTTAGLKFLAGWQAHEGRVADPHQPFSTKLGKPEGEGN